jgi:hypothetical protein
MVGLDPDPAQSRRSSVALSDLSPSTAAADRAKGWFGSVRPVHYSGFGRAIGVNEAINATLHQAERLPKLSDRLLLFLLVILFFVATLQVAYAAVALLRRSLAARTSGPEALIPKPKNAAIGH